MLQHALSRESLRVSKSGEPRQLFFFSPSARRRFSDIKRCRLIVSVMPLNSLEFDLTNPHLHRSPVLPIQIPVELPRAPTQLMFDIFRH